MIKVKDTPENARKCSCVSCPSFDECMNKAKEILYCSRGKSKCKFVKRGCFCGGCKVHKENNLSGGYFCSSGAA